MDAAIKDLNTAFGDVLAFSNDNMLKAKTGGPAFIKCRTAFGFVLFGKGRFDGHAFFLFRGTQYLADWLTNGNIGVSRSPSGYSIHDGFHTAFKSMKPQLAVFMSEATKKNITYIHCIGHSLGGALATICADWIRTSYKRKPYLYTYGSPRVGLESFAHFCTQSMGGERIFRVYHRTDIVPCIPIWPFVHTPFRSTDYWLPSPGFFPGAEYHDMGLYVKNVSGKPWLALASLRAEHKSDFSILRWLRSQTFWGFTIKTLDWLSGAIDFVLRTCFKAASGLFKSLVGTGFTLMDKLAYLLSRQDLIIGNTSDLVVLLISKMMQAIGWVKKIKKEDLNREFIRNVLLRLQQRANDYATQALGNVMVKGRQI